jgi:predicted component of viral defense system (DUF524 family)
VLTADEAQRKAQERVQLLEDGRYDYEVEPAHLRLGSPGGSDIVTPSSNPKLAHCGVIAPCSFVGRMRLPVTDAAGVVVAETALEVRSRKLGYDSAFRVMLDEIAEWCLDLALDIGAATDASLTPSLASSMPGLYQQFAFVRGLIGSRRFSSALQAIQSRPHTRIASRDVARSIHRPFRARASVLRDIARATRRTALPTMHPLGTRIPSVATHVSAAERYVTSDTVENRFVRFALERFDRFLVDIAARASTLNDRTRQRFLAEIAPLRAQLRTALALEPLLGTGPLASVPFASTVLQGREGYREVLRAYLLFGFSAKFSWTPNDDAYWVAQRDAATLYEYWAFLKLLTLVTRVARLGRPDASELVTRSAGGLAVMLRRGRGTAVRGTITIGKCRLSVRLNFNRSFRSGAAVGSSGSWTIALRPDYTLSVWPADLAEEEAEKVFEMVHVHFDAKYRVTFEDALRQTETETEREGGGSAAGVAEAKTADLAKMHAYRDGIRRSYGAYVLYPGDVNQQWRMYLELMPGLGAYQLRPGLENPVLETFLAQLLAEIADRASERARLAEATAAICAPAT